MAAESARWLLAAAIGAAMLGWPPVLWAQAPAPPVIQWDSKDVIESRMLNYKYTKVGADYTDPKEGANYGGMGVTVSDEPPRLMDRVLKRQAKVAGKIFAAPPAAKAGRIWIEDNYGRVIDQAELKGPDFAFTLDASRSLKTGLEFKAELTDGDKVVWSGSQPVRMAPPDEDPWGDFLLGIYNMGARPGTGELFRLLGLNHRAIQTTNAPDPAVQNDLHFHASNILYSLLGLYHRDFKRWWEIQAAEKADRGPIKLARHRCLSDPKEEKFITDILTAAAMRFKPYKPLHYSIGDEIGIGDMASPHDLCGSQWCLARYRQWLKDKYGTIERLNAQWESPYKTFDEVEMMSNWQALDRAKTGNFSPWADRLAFMDKVLYGAVAKGVQAVRAIDPGATCNVSGVQQPSCWQFDHWLLTQTVNCATPYEIGEGPDVLMSFYEDGKKGKVHCPGFGGDTEGLWRAFIRGYGISQQWDSNPPAYSALIDIDKQALTPFGQKVKEFADWAHAGPGRMRCLAQRRRDPVAILYSQPSLRGNWILEMTARPDVSDGGARWITRGSWSVRKKELSFRVRVSWVQWARDVGIWPKFVDASQVDDGYLTANGYKVLILPRAVAIADRTADAIRKFADAGGTVIADTWCGIMDENCRLRAGNKGALDDLFGIARGDYHKLDVTRLPPDGKGATVGGVALPFVAFESTLKAGAAGQAGGNSKGADVAVSRPAGKGRALYLNFDMESYFLHRLTPAMVEPARKFLLETFAQAGVKPAFPITAPGSDQPFHPAGHDVAVYASGRGFLVGVFQNPTVMHSEVGGVETRYSEIKDNVFMKAHPARMSIPARLFAYDLVEHKALGDVRAVEFTSTPQKGQFFACWPFEIKDVTASAEVAGGSMKIAGKVGTSAAVEDEKLAVALRILRPDGSEQPAYRRTIDCAKGQFALEFPLALNEHGNWTVEILEPCTGKKAAVKVRLP